MGEDFILPYKFVMHIRNYLCTVHVISVYDFYMNQYDHFEVTIIILPVH